MYTAEQIAALIGQLRPFYSDVRLLTPEQLDAIREGERTDPRTDALCYASCHKAQFCRHCAVKAARAAGAERSKLEYFSPDIAQITARPVEVDGRQCVLELIHTMPDSTLVETDDSEHLLSQLTGYDTMLYHDALTGVYNRRYYEDFARTLVGDAGVAVLDLDDFKIYNDTYGHHGGDVALETAAHIARRNIRQSDSLIRFGGDEFLLVLPHITPEVFDQKLNTIRDEIRNASVPGFPHLHITVSVGGVLKTDDETLSDAVRRADLLMYRSKEQKDRVVVEGSAAAGAPPALPGTPQKPQILIVDDSNMNRAILSEILEQDFRILEAASGGECLTQLHEHPGDIALVLLDLVMPDMDGFDVLGFLNRNHTIEDVPVIMISSEESDEYIRRAYEMGASDYVARPFDAKVVYQRVLNTIKLYAKQRRLVTLVSDQIRSREKNVSMMVAILSQIVEFRNGESAMHVQHIRALTEYILEWLSMNPCGYQVTAQQRDFIPLASALHDIGKIGIPDSILNKPGRLTTEEFEIMKTHTTLGARMLNQMKPYYPDEPLLETAYEIARWHHERWDGKGYPDGLAGDEIPLSAQVVSLADVYDALTSDRCYKKAYPHETAIRMILNGECGTFNPVLLRCLREIEGSLQQQLREASFLPAGEHKEP